jgi:hypothetical protein
MAEILAGVAGWPRRRGDCLAAYAWRRWRLAAGAARGRFHRRPVRCSRERTMARYGPKAKEKVEENLHELKQGTLKSGTGAKVTKPKQAIAIGLSQARREGGKVPPAPGRAVAAGKAASKSAGKAGKGRKPSSR